MEAWGEGPVEGWGLLRRHWGMVPAVAGPAVVVMRTDGVVVVVLVGWEVEA